MTCPIWRIVHWTEEIERLCRDLEEMKRRREEEVEAMDEAERRCRAATATQTDHAPAHQTSGGSVLGGQEDSDLHLKEARASQEAEAQLKETREREARTQSLERKVGQNLTHLCVMITSGCSRACCLCIR